MSDPQFEKNHYFAHGGLNRVNNVEIRFVQIASNSNLFDNQSQISLLVYRKVIKFEPSRLIAP